ncbi:MAG: tetraacyldisaccharide 4'-kinase, partial [Gammaproteobacteria bacterium]|nr:tetraacyldisaccharide 4'-kinase [Gammaproteobacteria bacterium]
AIVVLRRTYYRYCNRGRNPTSAFVIVIGNITVGGTGKTPFLIWLARQCCVHGLKTGIITRGYKGTRTGEVVEVGADSPVEEVGDEAVLLARKTACPVVAAADRGKALAWLVQSAQPDVVLSDDGLQHYAMDRDFEIAVIDSTREFGNGRCLPAGPLREPVSRLQGCDLVVRNGRNDNHPLYFEVVPEELLSLDTPGVRKGLHEFSGCTVHAVAGVGNPARFFEGLRQAGVHIIEHAFADHHAYVKADLEFGDDAPILMTEKDAVKCETFLDSNIWYLPIIVQPNAVLEQRISTLIEGIPIAKATT